MGRQNEKHWCWLGESGVEVRAEEILLEDIMLGKMEKERKGIIEEER